MEKRLKRVLFSITVNHGSDTLGERTADNNDASAGGAQNCTHSGVGVAADTSYNELRRMIGDMGGNVSATVHKKVDFVVASAGAVSAATQRLRKADKFRVPVVKVEYILDVYAGVVKPEEVINYLYGADEIASSISAYKECSRQSLLSASESNIQNGGGSSLCGEVDVCTETSHDGKIRRKRKMSDPHSSSQAATVSSGLTIECSCICHDRGESSCSWCLSAHTGFVACNATSTCGEDPCSKVKKNKKKKKSEKIEKSTGGLM